MSERRIRFTAGGVEVVAELCDTPTAGLVWEALPITASGSTWGDEIYFRTPVSDEERDAVATVEMGAVAYWPAGRALCLFFGPTPASAGGEPAAISPVNPVGMIEGDALALRAVRSGAAVSVERA